MPKEKNQTPPEQKRNKWLEKTFSAPAAALDHFVGTSEALGRGVSRRAAVKKAEQFWHTLGPGLTTGAADDDPSGIATYSQAGAQNGLGLLWLAPLTFPLMAVVQEMCARIGLVTGQGLAANIRKHYPSWVLYSTTLLLFLANTFNLGVDLGAMAKATQLVLPRVGFTELVFGFTLLSLLLQIYISYKKYAKYLKWLSLILFSYVVTGLIIHLNPGELLWDALVPSLHFTRNEFFLITGVLGTTISPYLFFWQTSQEVEEEILAGKTNLAQRMITSDREIKKMRVDVWSGMFISNLVMFFIIAVCGTVLYRNGITNITTAAQAAAALRPLAGPGAALLFTLGIIGTGMLAVPILAGSASYALSESFIWREGLYRKLRQAHAFYGVIIVSMLIGLSLNFTRLDPIKALIYAAVVNGLIAPVVLVVIVRMSGDKKIMHERVSSPATKFWGWFITILMIASGLATIITLFTG